MRGSTLLVAVLAVLTDYAASVSLGTDGTTAMTATSAASPPTADSATESPVATATPTTLPPSATATVTPTAAPTESPTLEPTTTFTPVPDYGPWGSEPVVVSVVASDDDHDYVTLVSEATAFQGGSDSRYLGYEINYEVDADARNPDLVVRSTDGISVCSELDDTAGCAPCLTDGWRVNRPETVYAHTGYGDDSTVGVVAHELGHTFGLAHSNEPADLMNATGILYTLPWTNAIEKAFPWDDPNFTVHIDDTNASNPDATREQVHHALDYFEDNASGMPDNLTCIYVNDFAGAEVCISFTDNSPCAAGAASYAIADGYDPDGDDALETCDSYRVVLVDLDAEAVGWHVGYWTAHYLGTEADDDEPEPFRNAMYGERRNEWWAQRRRRVVSRALHAADGGFRPDKSAESFFGMAPVERVVTPTDRHDDTHPASNEESFRDALAEFGGTDAKRRVVARQAHDLMDSGQAEADHDAPFTGDEIVRNIRDAPDGDPATRWN